MGRNEDNDSPKIVYMGFKFGPVLYRVCSSHAPYQKKGPNTIIHILEHFLLILLFFSPFLELKISIVVLFPPFNHYCCVINVCHVIY